MPNRLEASSSPYLKQHQDNPVDWYPWSEEALSRSKLEGKPIFLSIGYSSCHWCHVMEQESFSDPEIAQILKDHFISIKVDREERPDLDHVYMTALQMMTGQGGWPLNIFLTPELKPFFGGTYFAPDSRYGRPPFREILLRIADIFKNQKDMVKQNSEQLTGLLVQQSRFFESRDLIDNEITQRVLRNIVNNYDATGGGLGGAPKFFHSDGLRLALRASVEQNDRNYLDIVSHSIAKMAWGGVYDHIGGGFHRYSTDALWQVPHFEKMLYDNALLAVLFTETWQVTQNPFFKNVLTDIFSWVEREMTSEAGGFYSAIDADSEHHEGLFYIWSEEELKAIVPANLRDEFFALYNVSAGGNFEGKNILHLSKDLTDEERERFKSIRELLLKKRNQRVHPLLDSKIQTSWNGLMITALAQAGFALNEPKYTELAKRAADYILRAAWNQSDLKHLAHDSLQSSESFLEDYAYFIEGLLQVLRVTRDSKYFKSACELSEAVLQKFYDIDEGGFWTTRVSTQDLLVRHKQVHDGALPSAQSVMISNFLHLYELTGDGRYREAAQKSIQAVLGSALETPGGFHRFAMAVNEYVDGVETLVAVSPHSEFETEMRKKYSPRAWKAICKSATDFKEVPFFDRKWSSEPKLYSCKAGSCTMT